MKEKEFRAYLEGRKQQEDSIDAAISYVKEFDEYLGSRDSQLDRVTVEAQLSGGIQGWLSTLP